MKSALAPAAILAVVIVIGLSGIAAPGLSGQPPSGQQSKPSLSFRS